MLILLSHFSLLLSFFLFGQKKCLSEDEIIKMESGIAKSSCSRIYLYIPKRTKKKTIFSMKILTTCFLWNILSICGWVVEGKTSSFSVTCAKLHWYCCRYGYWIPFVFIVERQNGNVVESLPNWIFHLRKLTSFCIQESFCILELFIIFMTISIIPMDLHNFLED